MGIDISYTQLLVALRYDLALTRFAETHAPSKQKHANLSTTDRRRFHYYDIIAPVPDAMGAETVWQVTDWAERLLDYTKRADRKPVRPDKQTRDALDRHAESLIEIRDTVASPTSHPYWETPTFRTRDIEAGKATVAHWSDYGFIRPFHNDQTRRKPTEWQLTAWTEYVLGVYEAVTTADPSLVPDVTPGQTRPTEAERSTHA